MSRFFVLCFLALCSLTTAFSLKQRISSPLLSRAQSPASTLQHSQPTFLKTTEDPVNVEVTTVAQEKKGGLISEEVKLVAYLAVWYLGNIYCKF
jgi:hypothetical protein